MIVLDTSVVAELFRPRPEEKVIRWLASLSGEDLYTTAITRGELMYGVRCLPAGRWRDELLRGVTELFDQRLAGHVLPYEGAAVDAFAELAARRRVEGHTGGQSGMMIASIAWAHSATLATHSPRDFEDCGINVLDPWQ